MKSRAQAMTKTNLQDRPQNIYFRRDPLGPADRRDLDRYAEHLRAYYGIPDGQPVFPARRASKAETPKPSAGSRRPRPAGTNRADHPWRGTL